MPLRVAAISFLNPAPLLYSFEHAPTAGALAANYALHYTSPASCAAELLSGRADLGLIPIASLTPGLAIVPGCTIASLNEVRSILLLVKNPHQLTQDHALEQVRTIAADSASRSSQAYTHILFEQWHGTRPHFHELAADAIPMLAAHDAALLIGDPALHAREHKAAIEAAAQTPLLWLDLAQLWRARTGLPWVAAVWAVRPESLSRESTLTPHQLTSDLTASRDNGLRNIPTLVNEWSPRTGLPREIVRTYLTHNIHYTLDDACIETIRLFRDLAAQSAILPPLPDLHLLK